MDFLGNTYTSDTYAQIEWLVKEVAREGMIVADVGCLAGSASFKMLPIVKEHGGTAYLIDWFRGSPDTEVGEHWTTETYPTGGVIETLLDNLREAGFEDTAIVSAVKSHLAPRILADESIDLCFIAADHRYSAVMNDIKAWWPKIRQGGILAGHAFDGGINRDDPHIWQKAIDLSEHDYAEGNHWGTVRAVMESFDNFEHAHACWWVKK